MMARTSRFLLIALALGAIPATRLSAQSVQYRSPAGVEYRSQPDTGAIARAQQALATDPRNVERIIELGIAQSGARQFREAIETFTRGLEIAPNNALLYRWRGHRYLSIREFDRALMDLERGARIDSSIYGIWYHLGVLRFLRGEFDLAARAFARGLPIAPNAGERAGSYDWQWMSLSRAGRPTEAAALITSMPDSVPTAAANAYSKRLLLYKGVLPPDAVLMPADTGDVNVATLAYGLGNWYIVQRDTAKAREFFRRAIESGGWPAFGFMVAEAELRRLR